MIQKKTPRNKAHLLRSLVKLEYRDSQNMIELLNSFEGLVNKLTEAEMTIDDELHALLLLSSLPENMDKCVVTLSNSSPDGKLSMDIKQKSFILNEEVRIEKEIKLELNPEEDRRKMFSLLVLGDIILSSGVGCQLILKDVKHVPDMRLNLILVGKLDDDGLQSHYGNGKWKLTKGNLVVAQGIKEGSLYVMRGKLCKDETNVVVSCHNMQLWHRRLGHDEHAKLDAKTKQCIYLGAPKDEFGYRLWDPIKKKIRSKDVFFDDRTVKDIKKPEKPKHKIVDHFDPPMTRNETREADAENDPQ
ncbi:Retrovirus-related Pol polyprotein from transposon TNT 1-94 [Sesamum alatum]|uniref:Retrovirus-related Pol polyprotein from transposon TNT 1-94 n=1 Tax=Sesamum alatum TaxID=300844 RepID=A0AAE1YZJ8_9LAMI|nr:Retrovirus-related Pol polyprotein from transposon TNT 1-94 [Sesamum alatum]